MYRTSKNGRDMFYSDHIVDALSYIVWIRMPYRSIWRVLHIDDFEDYPRLPACRGHQIQFFAATQPSAE